MTIFIWIIQILFVPLVSPLCVGIIRKIKAILQNRRGASIFQPYRDLWKLLHKDEVISTDASWIFCYAPFIIFTATLVVGMSIPLFGSFFENKLTGDILIIIYTLAIGTFFLALSGMDTGSAFGGFGSSREMTLSALAEGGFVFSLLVIAIISGTTDVFAISSSDIFAQGKDFLSVFFVFSGFFIILLAETSRFPFDNPATHLELTMVHEAMILEYSGKRLALMEWASSNKLLIFFALGANLFFPVGLAQSAEISAIAIGIIVFMIKIGIFCFFIALIESSMAKFRFFRLPDLLLTSFILNVVALGLIYRL
ncbi:MAG: NADH-quinone oxidoreductase subunit H [Candidatus Moraniibacteriota bacterium]|nr:MAG: NADH-quinone oxidoreductase subunit H [Candidatus Moranbacteria bacterium]